MAKLTKQEVKDHEEALRLLEKDVLTFDEKITVYEKWHEGATSVNSQAGAFFTPELFAKDFSLEVFPDVKVIDLCAGIGILSFYAHHWRNCEVTCIELNPTYAEVGKKLLPEANWINASIFDYKDFGHFDQVISNPPFGKIKTGISDDIKKELKYKGAEFELMTIEIGSKVADYGSFIIPQMSTPFKYSGNREFYDLRQNNKGYNPHGLSVPAKVAKFIKETEFDYQFNVGIDTSFYVNDWKGVSPICEVVNFDYYGKWT